MPPHLAPEEQKEWLEEAARQEQDLRRRKKEGFYLYNEDNNIVSKIISKFNFKPKKKDDNVNIWH